MENLIKMVDRAMAANQNLVVCRVCNRPITDEIVNSLDYSGVTGLHTGRCAEFAGELQESDMEFARR